MSAGADTFVLFSLLWLAAPQGWSGPQTAAVVLVLRLPTLATGMLCGRAVDRWGSRRVANADCTTRAALLVSLAVLSRGGDLPLPAVLLLGAAAGALSPASYAAVRALMPHLVGSAALPRANTVVAAGDQLQLLAGAALVGPALHVLAPGTAMLVPAAMLVIAAGLAGRLPVVTVEPVAAGGLPLDRGAPARGGARSRVAGLVALSTAYYFVYGPFEAVTPFHVREQLCGDAAQYSVLWAAFAAGALLSLPSAPWLSQWRPGAVNGLGAVAWGLVMLPLALVDGLAGAGAIFFVGGVMRGPYSAVEATALHRWVPAGRHGRVFGVQRSLLASAAPPALRSAPSRPGTSTRRSCSP